MDKRSSTAVVSPNQLLSLENCKRIKVSISPKKGSKENNALNFQNNSHSDELDGLCFDDDEDDFYSEILDREENRLDLSTFQRCVVQNIEKSLVKFEKILFLREKKSQKKASCCVQGPWFDTPVNIDDIVSVQGAWCEERKMFVVSASDGIIVTKPDTLVSGTTVVGSLFCARKSALAERFRTIDSSGASVMHIGSVVHEILQTVLRKNLKNLKEIQKAADNFLENEATIQLLYSCKMTLEDIRREVDPFITRIHDFMRQYLVGDLAGSQGSNEFKGRIDAIQDIEESVWCPRLGLKGKIDVSVKVTPQSSLQRLMPLEIKTGRASFSLEHKGQLILYQMMLQDLGTHVDSGLLLYIREGIMREVGATQAEKRGLIQMRNRLAHFLSLDLVTKEKEANLPDPISHHSACARCEYNTVCCTFLGNRKLTDNHPLIELRRKLIKHLSDDHINFFLHWCHLVTLEHNEAQKSIKLRHIWTKTPEVRAAKGVALINLEIKGLVQSHDDTFTHHFWSPSIDFTTTLFEIGDYLIVSTDKRCSVAAGRVIKVEPSTITLSLPRDLSTQHANCKFHIDRYESQSQSVFNFSSLAALLEENNSKLREIIIDKTAATFGKSLPKIVSQQGEQILQKLNPVQRKGVLKALTCENFMLIKGLPGTGKTQTLVALIQLLMILKKYVLITSHTNSAVDNILLRLMPHGIKFMRLGSASRTHPLLRNYLESSLVAACKTVDELEKVYSEFPIIAVTCLGSSHALLSQRKFDYCLVDEATQIFLPTVIRPLFAADKFVLVGDPQQLAPLVRSSDAKSLGADESLFERLDAPESTMVLGLQYRMNRVITKLANSLTYDGQLQCASEAVAKASMVVPNAPLLQQKLLAEKWLAKALSSHIDQSCTLINTSDVYQISTQFAEFVKDDTTKFADKSKLYVNYCEIAIVLRIVSLLIECGVTSDAIGIIAPYRGQVDALKKVFVNHEDVEVNTVDQYQGRDKKIIIYSCTQSKMNSEAPKSSDEILDDRRRLTVAITRAKHKLIMVGDASCLNNYTPFKDLFKHMSAISKILVEEGKLGFNWNQLLDDLRLKF